MIKRLYFLCLGIALGHSIGCASTQPLNCGTVSPGRYTCPGVYRSLSSGRTVQPSSQRISRRSTPASTFASNTADGDELDEFIKTSVGSR